MRRLLLRKGAWSAWSIAAVVLAVVAAGVLFFGEGRFGRFQPDEIISGEEAEAQREAEFGPRPSQEKEEEAEPRLKVKEQHKVYAAWYDVPEDSLAKRRAQEDELTAAHNQLPLGTLVRVTHLKNGKQVLVRITDRGIRKRRIKVDLCKEAAEELGMVREGIARVKMEVLVEEQGGTAIGSSSVAAPR